MVVKTCIRCGLAKSEKLFNRDNKARDGRRSSCVLCVKAGLTKGKGPYKGGTHKAQPEITGSYVFLDDETKKEA